MLAIWLPAAEYGDFLQPSVYVASGGWGFSPTESSLSGRLLNFMLRGSIEKKMCVHTSNLPKLVGLPHPTPQYFGVENSSEGAPAKHSGIES